MTFEVSFSGFYHQHSLSKVSRYPIPIEDVPELVVEARNVIVQDLVIGRAVVRQIRFQIERNEHRVRRLRTPDPFEPEVMKMLSFAVTLLPSNSIRSPLAQSGY